MNGPVCVWTVSSHGYRSPRGKLDERIRQGNCQFCQQGEGPWRGEKARVLHRRWKAVEVHSVETVAPDTALEQALDQAVTTSDGLGPHPRERNVTPDNSRLPRDRARALHPVTLRW